MTASTPQSPAQSEPGYPEEQPQRRGGGEPDENTPHEHQNVPTRKPQPTP